MKNTLTCTIIFLTLTFQLNAQNKHNYNDCSFFNNESIVWSTDYKDGFWYIIRGKNIEIIKDDTNKLIEAWNSSSDIKIQFVKNKWETIFIYIPDSFSLTQSKGSTGSLLIMASLIYTLTENSQYKYVYVDFEPGEHAVPGIYSRKDFEKDFRICF